MKFRIQAHCNSGETWECLEEAESEEALVDKIRPLEYPMWRTAPDGPPLDSDAVGWVESVRHNTSHGPAGMKVVSLSRLFGLEGDDRTEWIDLSWKPA